MLYRLSYALPDETQGMERSADDIPEGVETP
jgi:hypothetical protein